MTKNKVDMWYTLTTAGTLLLTTGVLVSADVLHDNALVWAFLGMQVAWVVLGVLVIIREKRKAWL